MSLHTKRAANEQNEIGNRKKKKRINDVGIANESSYLKKRDKNSKACWRDEEWENDTKQNAVKKYDRTNYKPHTKHSHGKTRNRFVLIVNYNGWHFHVSHEADLFCGNHSNVCSSQFLHDFEIHAIGWQIVFRAFAAFFPFQTRSTVNFVLHLVFSLAVFATAHLGELNAVWQKFFFSPLRHRCTRLTVDWNREHRVLLILSFIAVACAILQYAVSFFPSLPNYRRGVSVQCTVYTQYK